MPRLEETFADAQGRWRVVDKGDEDGRPGSRRFAVMALPINVPLPTSLDDPNREFELCAVQYRPHAEAIAALPELANALHQFRAYNELDEADFANAGPMMAYANAIDAMQQSIAKAEGRA